VLFASVLLAVIGLCAIAWTSDREFPVWAAWVQAALLLLTAAGAARAWHCSPVGTLRWDGEHWLWRSSQDWPVSGLHMVFDFQNLVLVSVQRDGGDSLYLWLEPAQGTAPAWRALRRALVHSTAQGLAPSPSADPEGLSL